MKKNEMTTRSNWNQNERLDDLDSSQKADNQNENHQISAVSILETFQVLNYHKNLVLINEVHVIFEKFFSSYDSIIMKFIIKATTMKEYLSNSKHVPACKLIRLH